MTSPIRPTHDAPFRGLRVLDFGQGVASPYAGYLLAANGADVIKVEPPEGDWSRRLGTTYGSHSSLSAVYNRGKRSLVLDLKKPEAIETARKLATAADVVIEGFRPGVMQRLGLGYTALRRDNPMLVYLSISGFGQDGPFAQRPCSDSVAQAFSGLVSVNAGTDGVPHRVGATLSDVCTGLYGFQAVSTALYARLSVGEGRHIDASLTQSTAALLGHKFAEHILEGGAPRPLNVPAGSYRTSDGWIMVTLVTEAQFGRLCAVLERPDLASNPRYVNFATRADHADDLVAALREVFPTDTTSSWLARLHAQDIIADRILNPSEWVANEHVRATGGALRAATAGVGDVYAARTPGRSAEFEVELKSAPDVGQDTPAIMASGWLSTGSI